ncbi:MAG: hypothetical protein P0116_03985 [Candidatus Nitrosocosmicus sp.]|nr:hypothetical protein [Candidatus Nitrosocosmicus sp.]
MRNTKAPLPVAMAFTIDMAPNIVTEAEEFFMLLRVPNIPSNDFRITSFGAVNPVQISNDLKPWFSNISYPNITLALALLRTLRNES